jgi:hypothetical protein
MSRPYSLDNPLSVAEALKRERDKHSGRLWTLLDDAAGLLRRIHEARGQDAEEHRRLLDRIAMLGGGHDRRGLDGDPREPHPAPQELKQGTWVDEGSHA